MSIGRSYPFTKHAATSALDGSVPAEALYVKPGPIAGIDISLAANATGAAAAIATRFELQVWTGSVPNGAGWTITGGAWATVWSIVLGATTSVDAPDVTVFSKVFDPPLELPLPYTVLAGGTHAKVGQYVPANTHNAAEVAGEWDVRVIATKVQGGIADTAADADISVQTAATPSV